MRSFQFSSILHTYTYHAPREDVTFWSKVFLSCSTRRLSQGTVTTDSFYRNGKGQLENFMVLAGYDGEKLLWCGLPVLIVLCLFERKIIYDSVTNTVDDLVNNVAMTLILSFVSPIIFNFQKNRN